MTVRPLWPNYRAHYAACSVWIPWADRTNWYKKLFEDFQPGEEEQLDLVHLFDNTIQSLNSLDFDFQMELPADDAPLSSKLSAMADWCQGLVFGLGTSGMTNETDLSDDCQEFVHRCDQDQPGQL